MKADMQMRQVLFVCTANQCRSPMLEGLFRNQIDERGMAARWSAASAGTWAMEGEPATAHAIQALAEIGVDISAHRSRPVDAALFEASDFVFVMEFGHLEALRVEFPQAMGRLHLLSEWLGKKYEIRDPIGEPIQAYRNIVREFQALIEEGLQWLEEQPASA